MHTLQHRTHHHNHHHHPIPSPNSTTPHTPPPYNPPPPPPPPPTPPPPSSIPPHPQPKRRLKQLECGTWYHLPRRLQCVKFSKSQRDIIDAVTISKIIVFEIICNVACYSEAKIAFSIAQPSNKATKCDIRGFWKLKVKPNLGCCSNIAITISYISVFVSSWQSQDWQSYGRLSAKVTH